MPPEIVLAEVDPSQECLVVDHHHLLVVPDGKLAPEAAHGVRNDDTHAVPLILAEQPARIAHFASELRIQKESWAENQVVADLGGGKGVDAQDLLLSRGSGQQIPKVPTHRIHFEGHHLHQHAAARLQYGWLYRGDKLRGIDQ